MGSIGIAIARTRDRPEHTLLKTVWRLAQQHFGEPSFRRAVAVIRRRPKGSHRMFRIMFRIARVHRWMVHREFRSSLQM
jgi:hypothetical protein